MRIAQVSPLFESVPPKLYGGTERVVAYLTEALVEAGHDVTTSRFSPAAIRSRARCSGRRQGCSFRSTGLSPSAWC
jgi:hypothetical protein